ncbi:LysE/ArgO family amino acid transporter [Nocardioides sp. AE5]|uniref:LysE/ArgO family amino acid transporter n=1 Tax=Nocardioides sp. AE5 TaxID=2962573 RepID=UPI002880FACD|nr:LysE/ArgO family amino acid transporter [Nocardioides sp. AE5]MDT0202973.1 LysE/ArgO family amino acid transporter [Nocardioides sp. AE5]
MITPAALGFASGLSLIIAIGAQNAFVLRQGLRREHVGAVVAVCALSDAVLIVAGIAGLGALVQQHPGMLRVLTWFGAAFLIGYGLLALRRTVRPTGGLEAAGNGAGARLSAAITTCLALTWLNPHVYLDTVVLLGSLGNAQGTDGRWPFALGAVLASLVWFAALGYGARLLRRFMARPSSWRILDGFVAVVMLGLGVLLLVRG